MGVHFYILLTWQKRFRLLIIKTCIPLVAINSSPLLSWTPVILNPPLSWTKSHFPLWCCSVIYYWLCQTSVILHVEDSGILQYFLFCFSFWRRHHRNSHWAGSTRSRQFTLKKKGELFFSILDPLGYFLYSGYKAASKTVKHFHWTLVNVVEFSLLNAFVHYVELSWVMLMKPFFRSQM